MPTQPFISQDLFCTAFPYELKHSKHIKLLSHPRMQLELSCHYCFSCHCPLLRHLPENLQGCLKTQFGHQLLWKALLAPPHFLLLCAEPALSPPYVTTPRPGLCLRRLACPSISLSSPPPSLRFPGGKDFDLSTLSLSTDQASRSAVIVGWANGF